jgi:ABC-2 type transport system permease protein
VLAAWLAGYVVVFAACGAAATGVGSILGASTTLRAYLLKEGYQATIIHAYLSGLMLLASLAAAVYATSTVLRLRTEETGNLAEPVLATATGRIRWGLSHVGVAAVGGCLLLTTAGVSAGLGYGIATGSGSTQVPAMLGAALARLPAVLVLAAVAVLLFGLLPWESVALAWSTLGLAGVIAVFGPPLQWPAWMMDLSPFTQAPKLPGGPVPAEPLVWLCGIVVALAAAGLAGLRRRDIGDLGPSRLAGPVLDRLAEYVRESDEITRAGGVTPAR